MASALYTNAKQLLAEGAIHWKSGGDTFHAVLVDTNVYTFDAAHDFADHVTAGIVGTSTALTSPTATDGACDADDATFSGLVAAPTVEALVIFKFVTNHADSPLIAYIDQAASGLPTPAGVDSILVTWDSGANKIFHI